MHVDGHEQRWAGQWFVGAGLFALLLCAFVIGADYYLSHQYVENTAKHDEELRALRDAQVGVGVTAVDPRMKEGQ